MKPESFRELCCNRKGNILLGGTVGISLTEWSALIPGRGKIKAFRASFSTYISVRIRKIKPALLRGSELVY